MELAALAAQEGYSDQKAQNNPFQLDPPETIIAEVKKFVFNNNQKAFNAFYNSLQSEAEKSAVLAALYLRCIRAFHIESEYGKKLFEGVSEEDKKKISYVMYNVGPGKIKLLWATLKNTGNGQQINFAQAQKIISDKLLKAAHGERNFRENKLGNNPPFIGRDLRKNTFSHIIWPGAEIYRNNKKLRQTKINGNKNEHGYSKFTNNSGRIVKFQNRALYLMLTYPNRVSAMINGGSQPQSDIDAAQKAANSVKTNNENSTPPSNPKPTKKKLPKNPIVTRTPPAKTKPPESKAPEKLKTSITIQSSDLEDWITKPKGGYSWGLESQFDFAKEYLKQLSTQKTRKTASFWLKGVKYILDQNLNDEMIGQIDKFGVNKEVLFAAAFEHVRDFYLKNGSSLTKTKQHFLNKKPIFAKIYQDLLNPNFRKNEDLKGKVASFAKFLNLDLSKKEDLIKFMQLKNSKIIEFWNKFKEQK